MIGLDLELGGKTLEVVSPGLKSSNDRKHLFVVNLVVPFRIVHRLRVKGDWVPLAILPLL